jgi:hypothetical protein
MVIPFLRLHKTDSDDSSEKITFNCELPDPESEDDDSWLLCGAVIARAEAGILINVQIELYPEFIAQFDDKSYDTLELIEAVILSIGWGSPWLPNEIIEVEVIDPRRRAEYKYSAIDNRLVANARL